jgi:hypothetical protein
MANLIKIALVLGLAWGAGGCTSDDAFRALEKINPLSRPGDRHMNLTGPDQLNNTADQLNLNLLLGGDPTDTLEVALAKFNSNPRDSESRRNSVQAALLAASDQRCSTYIKYLQRQASNGNFFLGSLATLAGGVGAIVTGADTARALAGVAGIFSGVRAEYNQDYFANLSVHVIWHGIDVHRREIYQQIQRDGQTKSIRDYPVEAAIKDALYYHGECSLVAGLDQASSSIKTVEDPGLEHLTKAIIKANILRKALTEQSTSLTTLLEGKSAGDVGLPFAGTILGEPFGGRAVSAVAAALSGIADKADSAKQALNAIDPAKLTNPAPLRAAIDTAKNNALGEVQKCAAKAANDDRTVLDKLRAQAATANADRDVAAADLALARAQAAVTAANAHKVRVTFSADVDATIAAVQAKARAGAVPPADVAGLAAALSGKSYQSGC